MPSPVPFLRTKKNAGEIFTGSLRARLRLKLGSGKERHFLHHPSDAKQRESRVTKLTLRRAATSISVEAAVCS